MGSRDCCSASGVRVIFIGIFLCWYWSLDFSAGVFIVFQSVERTKKHKDEESSNLQALIQEASCAEDGQLDTQG